MDTYWIFHKVAVGIMTPFNPRPAQEPPNGHIAEQSGAHKPMTVNSHEAVEMPEIAHRMHNRGYRTAESPTPLCPLSCPQCSRPSSWTRCAAWNVRACANAPSPGHRSAPLPHPLATAQTGSTLAHTRDEAARRDTGRVSLKHVDRVPGVGTVAGVKVVVLRRPVSRTRLFPRAAIVRASCLGGSNVSGTC